MRPTVWKAFGRAPRYTALKEAFGFCVFPPFSFASKSVRNDRTCEFSARPTGPSRKYSFLQSNERIFCSRLHIEFFKEVRNVFIFREILEELARFLYVRLFK